MLTSAHSNVLGIAALASILMLAVIAAHVTPAHAAADRQQCQAQVQAHAKAGGYMPRLVKEHLARMRAVSKWRDAVDETHGPQFKRWSQAKNKSVQCGVALGKAHCIVKASPCSSSVAGFTF